MSDSDCSEVKGNAREVHNIGTSFAFKNSLTVQ